MTYDTAIALDQVSNSQLQHEVVANGVLNAISEAALFGVKMRQTQGLTFTLYGGNFPVDGAYVVVPDTTLRLTASTTNYIYVTSSGIITKVTSAPSGWPGPLASTSRALYALVVGTDAITSGTEYVLGGGVAGPQGPQGATGAEGSELYLQHRRLWELVGGSVTNQSELGFEAVSIGAHVSTHANASTSLLNSIPHGINSTVASAANTSVGYRSANYCFRGNAAKRGGFDVTHRWGFNVAGTTCAGMRSFFGLYDVSVGAPSASADPSAILNMIGVGSDGGDLTLSLMHNDGSGTATKSTLYSDGSPTQTFSARAAEKVYELRLWCDANASSISYSLTEAVSGDVATGSVSSDLPSSTTFLGWIQMLNTGATATQIAYRMIQVSSNTRY